MAEQAEKTKGRYSDVPRTPTDGLPLARDGRAWPGRRIVEAAVPNPGLGPSDKRPRTRVAVNAHVDALEREYAYGRLTDRAYHAGRAYQRILERAGGVREQSQGERVQMAYDPDHHIVARLTDAMAAVEMLRETSRITGKLGTFVLEKTLRDRLTFEDIASRMNGGRVDTPTVKFWAMTFRYSLENLGEDWDHAVWA